MLIYNGAVLGWRRVLVKIKIYGETSEGQKRYSPAACIVCERKTVVGYPDPVHLSTSYVEQRDWVSDYCCGLKTAQPGINTKPPAIHWAMLTSASRDALPRRLTFAFAIGVFSPHS